MKRIAREADMRSIDRTRAEQPVGLQTGYDDKKYPGKHASMKSNLRRKGLQMHPQVFPWARAVQML